MVFTNYFVSFKPVIIILVSCNSKKKVLYCCTNERNHCLYSVFSGLQNKHIPILRINNHLAFHAVYIKNKNQNQMNNKEKWDLTSDAVSIYIQKHTRKTSTDSDKSFIL